MRDGTNVTRYEKCYYSHIVKKKWIYPRYELEINCKIISPKEKKLAIVALNRIRKVVGLDLA